MSEAWLLIETSTRGGQVGLAIDDNPLSVVRLDPSRRQNRDLAPTVKQLLSDNRLSVKELTGVMVSQGPGSFTGLRVGIISAKVLAFAAGCALVAVPTFAMLAARIDAVDEVVILGDALRGQLYVQRYVQGVADVAVEVANFRGISAGITRSCDRAGLDDLPGKARRSVHDHRVGVVGAGLASVISSGKAAGSIDS